MKQSTRHKNKNKNKNKRKYRTRKYIKNIKNKTRKYYKKGGLGPSDGGFIIEIDEDNIPLNNGLNYLNAKQFIDNFLFTDTFIKTYLEKDPYLQKLYALNTVDFTRLYSGDINDLVDLIQPYFTKDLDKILHIFKLVDPKSQSEFIKNLYKSKAPQRVAMSPYRKGIAVSTGGAGSEEAGFVVVKSSEDGFEEVNEYLDAPKKNIAKVAALSVYSFFGATKKLFEKITAPAPPVIDVVAPPIVLSHSERRHVLSLNYGPRFEQFVIKLTINEIYFQQYEQEHIIYKTIQDSLRGLGFDPNVRLENFFSWQYATVPYTPPIMITLQFTYEEAPLSTRMNLLDNVTLEPKNIVNNSLTWGALTGVFNPLRVDFARIISEAPYISINSNSVKITKALTLIFDNLEFLYLKVGLLHGDFKTDNILVEHDAAIQNVTSAFMFDLDLTYLVPGPIPRYRNLLDTIRINPLVNNYLKNNEVASYSAGFLHFFDCYMAALSLVGIVAGNIMKKTTVKAAVEALVWKTKDIPHSINIFKTCYELIEQAGITSPHVGMVAWENLRLDNIKLVIQPADYQAQFATYTPIKKTVYNWILKNLITITYKPAPAM